MSNVYQKGTVIFQTGMWHPEKQGRKETAICIYHNRLTFLTVFLCFSSG